MSVFNLVFVNNKSKVTCRIPVEFKSEAQAFIDSLDKKKVHGIRVSYMKGNVEVIAYNAHEKTYQLVKA